MFSGSPRPYPRRERGPEYEASFETRKVTATGEIKLRGRPIFIAQSLAGHTIGLEPIDDHLYAVHFYTFRIGKVDTDQNTFI